jgi:hypothetical protein
MPTAPLTAVQKWEWQVINGKDQPSAKDNVIPKRSDRLGSRFNNLTHFLSSLVFFRFEVSNAVGRLKD